MIIRIAYEIVIIKIIGEAPQNVNLLLSLLLIFPPLLWPRREGDNQLFRHVFKTHQAYVLLSDHNDHIVEPIFSPSLSNEIDICCNFLHTFYGLFFYLNMITLIQGISKVKERRNLYNFGNLLILRLPKAGKA